MGMFSEAWDAHSPMQENKKSGLKFHTTLDQIFQERGLRSWDRVDQATLDDVAAACEAAGIPYSLGAFPEFGSGINTANLRRKA